MGHSAVGRLEGQEVPLQGQDAVCLMSFRSRVLVMVGQHRSASGEMLAVRWLPLPTLRPVHVSPRGLLWAMFADTQVLNLWAPLFV